MTRELLFSVTEADCRFDYFRGSGKGGQKRNKTSNAVRCIHAASGAVGRAEDTRSQIQNKRLAFKRMAESPAFQRWHMLEVARITGKLVEAQETVERSMKLNKLLVEGKDKEGRWVPLSD